jgi:hypothetical protein
MNRSDSVNTEKLNSWLGIAANVGVIIGIVFLAFEIRQNTEVAVSSAELDVSNRQVEFFLRLAENPRLSRVYHVGLQNPLELSEDEKIQFVNIINSVFMFIEGIHKQYGRGFIPEEGWKPYQDLIASLLINPLVREWWFNRNTVFSREFEKVVSEIAGTE